MTPALQPARHEFLLPLPAKVRTALRKRGRKEGLPAAAIARRVLSGDGASKAATADASTPPAGIRVAIDLAGRFTPEQVGGILSAAERREIPVRSFLEQAITEALDESPDAPEAPPGPVLDLDLGPHLSEAELAGFSALCQACGKRPEDVLAGVIRWGLLAFEATSLKGGAR